MSVKSVARRGALVAAIAAAAVAGSAAPSFAEAVPLQPPPRPTLELRCTVYDVDSRGKPITYTVPSGTVIKGQTCINGAWV